MPEKSSFLNLVSREHIEQARYYLTLLMLAGAMFGLVFSPPFISVALISLFILGLFDPLLGINPRWRARFPTSLRSPVFWGMAGLYLLLVAGIWQTEDWGYFTERLRIKVPLLALPLLWPGLPDFGQKEHGWIFGGFALFMLCVLLGVVVNYGLHFSEISDMIRKGQPMPVPRNHIRFSLLVALATLLSVGAYRLRAWGGRRVWLVIAAVLFVGQHVLAVRSGLAGAYGGIGVLVLALAWERGTWWPAVAGLVGLAALPIVAYAVVPSFRTKIQYARYELFHRDASKDTHEYSDEGRLTSLRLGIAVWQDNFWLGVGPGNLRQEMDARYAAALPGTEGKRPHNQFVSALAGSGLVGGVFTLGCFLLLACAGLRRQEPVYLAAWTVLFLSCLVENTLETSAGVTLFCLFLMVARPSPPKGRATAPTSKPPE